MRTFFFMAAMIFVAACSDKKTDDYVPPGSDGFESKSIVTVDPSLQSGMVLQQNAEFKITGKGTPGEPVRVTCSWENGKVHDIIADANGRWSAAIQTPGATFTPQRISVQGASYHPFTDILVGEVWMCSGQSNMEMSLSQAFDGEKEVANSTHSGIRLLKMPHSKASAPTDNFTATWKPCTPENTATFSAIGYYCACKIQSELNVPVGIISAAIGGTAIEIWMPKESVENDPELKADAELRSSLGGSVPRLPGEAYNIMIYPLRNLPIAGVVWNHGTANQDNPNIYMKFLRTLVAEWRKDHNSQFAFYISQICPYKRDKDFATFYSNPLLRFNQTLMSEELINSGVAVNDDVANINDIHPIWKREVGERLAFLALGQHYGKSNYVTMRSPIYDSHRIEGEKLIANFKYAPDGLKTNNGQAPTEFEICGADKVFYPAMAVIEGSTVELTSPQVPAPIAARMGWSFKKVTNLRAANGLPVSVFRTYDWADTSEEPNSR